MIAMSRTNGVTRREFLAAGAGALAAAALGSRMAWAGPPPDRKRPNVIFVVADAIGRRVYPTRPDRLGVSLFSQGGPAKVRQIKAWEMMPSNPY